MKLGVIAGVHEDITRLREALELLNLQDCDELVCLGDIVGYSSLYYGYPDERDAHGSIRLIQERCRHVVAGNHDFFAARRLPKHTTFNYPLGWYDLPIERQKSISQGAVWLYEDESPTDLTTADIAYLSELPELVVASHGDGNVLFSHYAFPNLIGDGVEFDPAESAGIRHHIDFMSEKGCDLAIFSHDLCDGIRIFSEGSIKEAPFGRNHSLPRGQVALSCPWVANGTEPNGVMVVDLTARVVPTAAGGRGRGARPPARGGPRGAPPGGGPPRGAGARPPPGGRGGARGPG
jgi:hypothetical protein